MRRAAKTDANQLAIVEALRRIGAQVYYIKEPVDLLVGYRGKNSLMEVKGGEGRLTKAQVEFIEMWPVDVHIVRSVEEAIRAVIGAEAMK